MLWTNLRKKHQNATLKKLIIRCKDIIKRYYEQGIQHGSFDSSVICQLFAQRGIHSGHRTRTSPKRETEAVKQNVEQQSTQSVFEHSITIPSAELSISAQIRYSTTSDTREFFYRYEPENNRIIATGEYYRYEDLDIVPQLSHITIVDTLYLNPQMNIEYAVRNDCVNGTRKRRWTYYQTHESDFLGNSLLLF